MARGGGFDLIHLRLPPTLMGKTNGLLKMSDTMSDLPQAESADPDGVQVALRAAQALWSRGDMSESLRWLRRAAESASDEGADMRSLQLAKAAAELRGKLFGQGDGARSPLEGSGVHLAAAEAGAAKEVGAGEPVARAAGPASPPPPPSSRAPRADGEQSSRPPSATQYVVHRPREAPRQLMGLSPSTLEHVAQRDSSSAHGAIPSWSADAERRASSASPPPLPRAAAADDYEELEAEPDEDDGEEEEPQWSSPAPTWPGSELPSAPTRESEPLHVSEPRLAVASAAVASSTVSSKPPPLPMAGVYTDDDDDDDPMRPEQPTVVIPPIEERARAEHRQPVPPPEAVAGASRGDFSRWEEAQPVGWSAAGHAWDHSETSAGPAELGSSQATSEGDASAGRASEPADPFGAPTPPSSEPSLEPVPPKLTARVHHQAVRVSFAPDARAAGQYVVRALREGEKPTAGERVALLVALEPGQPLV